ncbi:MAG: HlyD family efflux transporter periplasmic adaptor subunit [Rhodospirillaceae bacterium]|jgi:HlyD family secretion protein|nr:HlyD family efflux transporter periplasmic adaptor subunit [Rhodospirillaceae bacterium]
MSLPFSRRTLVIGSIILAIIVLVILSLQQQSIGVDVAQVKRSDLLVTIDDEGQTRLKDVYAVSAPVAGRVRRIDIEAGDPVIASETVLAMFEPSDPAMLDVRSRSEAEAIVRAAEAAVGLGNAEQSRAQAQLDFAQAELNRAVPLAERGTISQATLEQRQLSLLTGQAQRAEAVASLRKVRADLETARATLITAQESETVSADSDDLIPVRAPISGRVLRVLQESEGVVATGTVLMELGDPTELEIEVDLLSTDAVRIKPGDRVIIDDWGGDMPLEGRVRLVEPFGYTKVSALGIEEQRVNVIIDFVSPQSDWQSLGHGYRVETRVVVQDRKNVITIPVSALFRSGESWAVFADDDGTAVLKEITLGERNTMEAEVTGGLEVGDAVILHPSDSIEHGVGIERRVGL